MPGVLVVATSMAGLRVRAMTCVGMPWGRYRLGPQCFTMVVAVLVIVAVLVMPVIRHGVRSVQKGKVRRVIARRSEAASLGPSSASEIMGVAATRPV